ncbi:kinase-like protein [Artomyces pyxidatus]|uniref:Kinase-like protein n=1 Tax=Artomyces pyxidatus TaxID=48021 RepID=A0ACB8T0G9_9AGAM|nr:kinase-like protein [Artomyces pyxidatus]
MKPDPLSAARRRYRGSSEVLPLLAHHNVVGEGVHLYGEPLCAVDLEPYGCSVGSERMDASRAKFHISRAVDIHRHAVLYSAYMVPRPGIPNERRSEVDKVCSVEVFEKKILGGDGTVSKLSEAAILASIPKHRGVIGLHAVLETSLVLVLITDRIPTATLSLFLHQGGDHFKPAASSASSAPTFNTIDPHFDSGIPVAQDVEFPLVRTRLIASMFRQMCLAVALCHEMSVYHRNIRPSNFVVFDERRKNNVDGVERGGVIVKLTGFAQATTVPDLALDHERPRPSLDGDELSRFTATCAPRTADVWSLGVALVNMLYHCHPWSPDDEGLSFSENLRTPTSLIYKLLRFPHMTTPLATFLSRHVFCVFDNPKDQISARELAMWARDFPSLIGEGDLSTATGIPSPSTVTRFYPDHALSPLDHPDETESLHALSPLDHPDETESPPKWSTWEALLFIPEELEANMQVIAIDEDWLLVMLPAEEYSSPKKLSPGTQTRRPHRPAPRRYYPQFSRKIVSSNIGAETVEDGRAGASTPASVSRTVFSVAKSVLSQDSSKSRKHFHHMRPGQPMLR